MSLLNKVLTGAAIVLGSLLSMKAEAQDKINPFKHPNIEMSNWNSMLTQEQRIDSLKKYIAEDKTDTIAYVDGQWESGNFAVQAHLNFFGIPYDTIGPSQKYDTTNLGKFKSPLYYTTVSSNLGGHGMNAILVGDNPLDWNSWSFVEPQNDKVDVQVGTISIPTYSTVKINNIRWKEVGGIIGTEEVPFLTFNIVNGVPTLASYDTTRLVLSRNPPTAGAVVAPTEGDTLQSGLEKAVLKFNPSTDPDGDDVTNYIRVHGPGFDSTYTPTADSIEVPTDMLQENSEYSAEGWAVAKGDTTMFSTNPRKFRTPSGPTGIERITDILPDKYGLSQNFPNPFNPETKIRYNIEKPGMVSLKVYNVLGQEIEKLVDEFQFRGTYEADFNSKNLSSGVYLYRLQAGEHVETKKMVVGK